jgi:hypothetical protein
MNKKNEIVLDVIPIYKNETYPTEEAIWHFRGKIEKEEGRVYLLNNMLMEIEHKFSDCNAVIILEKGKVIEVL